MIIEFLDVVKVFWCELWQFYEWVYVIFLDKFEIVLILKYFFLFYGICEEIQQVLWFYIFLMSYLIVGDFLEIINQFNVWI